MERLKEKAIVQLGHVCDAFGITHPGLHAPALPCRSAKAQRLVLALPARGAGQSTGAERASHDAVGACCDSRLTPLSTTSAHRATLGAHAPRFHGYHAAWANKKKGRSESRKNAGSIGLRYIPASGFTSDLMPPYAGRASYVALAAVFCHCLSSAYAKCFAKCGSWSSLTRIPLSVDRHA